MNNKKTLLILSGAIHVLLAYYSKWVITLLIFSFYYAGGLLGINEYDHHGEEDLFILLFIVTVFATSAYIFIIRAVNRFLIKKNVFKKKSWVLFNGLIFITVSAISNIIFVKERLG